MLFISTGYCTAYSLYKKDIRELHLAEFKKLEEAKKETRSKKREKMLPESYLIY